MLNSSKEGKKGAVASIIINWLINDYINLGINDFIFTHINANIRLRFKY